LPTKQVALGLDLRGGAHLVLELDVESAEVEDRRSALQQSIEIVRRRIDAIGVAEPTVQALGTHRILVQLPGVQDPSSIRTLLGSTAKLTFHRVKSWTTSDSEITPVGSTRMPSAEGDVDYILDTRPLLQGERTRERQLQHRHADRSTDCFLPL
jgi:SecD/SecF fusion protein